MCVNISNVLNDNGYEVFLCATRAGGPLEKSIDPSVRYYNLRKRHSLDFSAFTRLVNLVRENRIELIHAHSSSVFWAVAVKFRIPETRIIWHDHLGLRINDWKKNFFYKLISKKIDAIIAVNNDLIAWSRRNMKVQKGNIIMINNFPLLHPLERNSDPEYFTVVCLANLRPQKDHATLIKAVSLLVKLDLPKKIRIILAGSNDQSDYTRSIKSEINQLSLQEIVKIAGPVENTALLLSSADCGVLTSVSEGLPLALLEYGMAGIPVVVTDVGECAEVTGRGKYGHVVPSGNYEALAGKLKFLIENPGEGERIGRLFKSHIISDYGPGQFIEKYKSILTRIKN